MALDVATLKTEIRAAFDAESDVEVDPAEARKRIADKLGAAIEKFVKTGTVTVASGIAVSTAGTAAAQTGATTATGTGTIS